jgi:hypothetical protein
MSSANIRFENLMKVCDLQSGLDLIAGLALADSESASVRINRFLDSLLRSPPDAPTYLSLLERLPSVLAPVLGDLRKRFAGKALPLTEKEEAIFQQVIMTWLKVANAYTHCAQLDAAQGAPLNLPRAALILQRCLFFTSLAIGEHHRAKKELAPKLWLNLHAYYLKAEEQGVTQENVPGCLAQSALDTNCAAAFIAPLLSDLSVPYALSLQDLEWIVRLADNWSSLVQVHRAKPDGALPAWVIDLGQDVGLCPSSEERRRGDFRLFDTSRLVVRLTQVRQQLNEGASPDQLELGSTASAAQCKRLLDALLAPWSLSLSPAHRVSNGQETIGTAKVDAGFPEMHYHISGKEFEYSAKTKDYSRQELELMLTFRHRTETAAPAVEAEVRQETPRFVFDEWQVVDQSALVFRLKRAHAGKRLQHGQLISICPHDGERFLLAKIIWLRQELNGALVAEVALLPGIPQAIAARPLAQQAKNAELFSRAFLLPPVRAVKAEQSLILPRGWFNPGRIVEIDSSNGNGEIRLARMVNIMGDGLDFERAGFTLVT